MISSGSVTLNRAEDLSQLIAQLGSATDIVLAHTEDPEFKATLDTIQSLGDRISVFFSRIRKILRTESSEKDIRFVAGFFFKNFSQISENTKAAEHIIKYVLKRPTWLRSHSERIIECLKLLYSDLLSLQIYCEELYKFHFGRLFSFDFGLDSHHELENLESLITTEKAYQLLELSEGASQDQIKRAFRNKAKIFHPDLNPSAARSSFLQLKEAYVKLLSKVVH